MIKINVNKIVNGENVVKSKEVSQVFATGSNSNPKEISQI
jgi:hypothetical protein